MAAAAAAAKAAGEDRKGRRHGECGGGGNAPAAAPPPPHTHTQKARRRRLDEVCLERHPEHSRNVIQSWIAQGKVLVNDQPVLKAGAQVGEGARVDIIAETPKYVCRAGKGEG